MGQRAPKFTDRDLGWNEILKVAAEIKQSKVRVGVIGERAEAKEEGSPLTVGEIAAVLEYGTEDGHIPARPFVRGTFDAERENLVALGRKLIRGALDGKITVEKGLNIIGSTLANAIKRRITDGSGVPPPNAPSTIAAKGSDRPLVDTGRLLGAITWSVVMGGKRR